MQSKKAWGWILGVVYIVAVAIIWIAASYVVQSVVESGISPFLITYICNSLFVVYLPIVEIARYWEDSFKNLWFKHGSSNANEQQFGDSEKVSLLRQDGSHLTKDCISPSVLSDSAQGTHYLCLDEESELCELPDQANSSKQPGTADFNDSRNQLDSKGRWTRTRVAKISLLISPFWFLAQLTFNLSLKYTTVTSNTILSSASSLFTFLVSLGFLEEKFTWVKLISVLLCMAGTIMVSLGDSASGLKAVSSNLLLGDVFALVSAGLYAIYVTLIRKKLPNEEKGEGQASMAQFLGFLGLFNFLIFLPVALILNFTKLEPFYKLSWNQFGIIIGKGLIDNVLSDYLWAKAVLLTSTTVATAGLTIQVPLAAIVDSATGHAPHLMDYLGGFAVMVGFTGINIPSDTCSPSSVAQKLELEEENIDVVDIACHLLVSKVDTSTS